MARAKTEAAFLTELNHSTQVHYKGSVWFKIPDTPVWPGADGSRFTATKPFDALWAVAGHTTAVEAKVHKKSQAWPVAAVKAHQIDALEAWERTGQPAFVVVNVRYGLGKARVNRAFILAPSDIRRYQKQGRKSLKRDELERHQVMTWDPAAKAWGIHALLGDLPFGSPAVGGVGVGADPALDSLGLKDGVLGAAEGKKPFVKAREFRNSL